MINKNQYELSERQVCLFFIAFLPVTKLFMLPSVLSLNAAEDGWICALFNFLLDFTTLFFVLRACKNAKTDFFGLLENTLGKTVSKIVLSLYFLFFIIKSVLPITEQKDYIEHTLYTLNPTVLYFCPFFLLAILFCTKRLRAVGRAADVLWVSTALGLLVIFALSVSNMDFTAILPVGANGLAKIVKGSLSSFTWFGDALYFAFFIGQFEYKRKSRVKILTSFSISAFISILFFIVFYAVFTSIAFRQKFALTEISKYSTVINNIGRFDYIGIMLILFSNLFALSLPLFFAGKIFMRLFSIKNKWICAAVPVGIVAIIVVFLSQYSFTFENIIMNFLSPVFLFFSNVLPVIISFFTKKENKNAVAQS